MGGPSTLKYQCLSFSLSIHPTTVPATSHRLTHTAMLSQCVAHLLRFNESCPCVLLFFYGALLTKDVIDTILETSKIFSFSLITEVGGAKCGMHDRYFITTN